MTTTNLHTDMFQHVSAIASISSGLIVGSARHTGSYWTGAIQFYRDGAALSCKKSCDVEEELDGGVTDIGVVGENQIIVTQDSGILSLWEVTTSAEVSTLKRVHQTLGHNDIINSASISPDKSKVVTGGKDHRVIVWKIPELTQEHTFRAHSKPVTCVAFHSTDSHIFASCSQDNKTLVWDTRKMPKPAKVIDMPCDSIPTCLAWKLNCDVLAVGKESGSLCIVDVNDTSRSQCIRVHQRPIHRIVFNKNNSSWLATAGDDCRVKVLTIEEESRIIYTNNEHQDMVSSVSWHPTEDKLYTSGRDHMYQCLFVQPSVSGNMVIN